MGGTGKQTNKHYSVRYREPNSEREKNNAHRQDDDFFAKCLENLVVDESRSHALDGNETPILRALVAITKTSRAKPVEKLENAPVELQVSGNFAVDDRRVRFHHGNLIVVQLREH